MIHERLVGDVGVDGIDVLELGDPCAFDGVDDEGAISAFGSFVQIETVPKRLVEGLGAGAYNGSGDVSDNWVDDRPSGRGEHLLVSKFLGSVEG